MANSPDLAAMDFAVNPNFKQIVKLKKAKDLKQPSRVIKAEWKKFPLSTIRSSFLYWKKRVNTMVREQDYQIDYFLA